jgi:ribosomal protein S5
MVPAYDGSGILKEGGIFHMGIKTVIGNDDGKAPVGKSLAQELIIGFVAAKPHATIIKYNRTANGG